MDELFLVLGRKSTRGLVLDWRGRECGGGVAREGFREKVKHKLILEDEKGLPSMKREWKRAFTYSTNTY